MSLITKRIGSAETFKNSPNVNPGRYTFEIVKLECAPKTNGHFFIAELKVVDAQPVEVGATPNSQNSVAAYKVKLDKPASFGNVKAFFQGLFDDAGDDGQAFGDAIDAACGPNQPYTGWKIKDVAFSKPQKADPTKSFTHHAWEHVAPTAEQLEATKSKLAAK